jgi:hypothetical protein
MRPTDDDCKQQDAPSFVRSLAKQTLHAIKSALYDAAVAGLRVRTAPARF